MVSGRVPKTSMTLIRSMTLASNLIHIPARGKTFQRAAFGRPAPYRPPRAARRTSPKNFMLLFQKRPSREGSRKMR